MKPAAFAYERATSLTQAVTWLKQHPEGKVLAGGQSLIPLMNFRLSRPQELLDINQLTELSYVEQAGRTLLLGTLIHHQELHAHKVVREICPLLSEAAGHVGHWAIRNRGTLGGSLVHADPAAELPAVMVALQATFVLASAHGNRHVSAAEFYLGFLTTDIRPDELLIRVEVPVADEVFYGFQEYSRRPGDFALAGAIAEVRATNKSIGAVTWFGVGGTPIREELEFALDEQARKDQFTRLVEAFDMLGEGPYRQQLAISAAEQAYQQAMRRVSE